MKRMFLILMSIYPIVLFSQGITFCMSGRVSDANGNALQYVTVKIETSGKVSGTSTDKDGKYSITYNGSDSIKVTFSLIGYVPLHKTLTIEKDISCNAVMEEAPKELSGITVVGDAFVQEEDHISYIPSKKQVNGANSGIGLLFNLMIPQIDVNRMTGEIKAVDNSSLGLYIDGRKASIQDINNLRPKDIKKVEYYDTPTTSYPGDQKVINYVLKHYEYGGYVDLRTDSRALYSQGDYSGQASVDMKKLNFTVLAGTKFSNDNSASSSSTDNFSLQQPFIRSTSSEDYDVKSRQHYGLLRTTYKTDATTIYLQASLSWRNNPESDMLSHVSYMPTVYTESPSQLKTYSKNVNPGINAYFFTRLKDNQTLQGNFIYNYGNNDYRRSYIEEANSDAPILSNTTEKTHGFDGTLNYKASLKHNNSISLYLWGVYDRSDADYNGTETDSQSLTSYNILFYPTYTQTFANRLTMTIQAGFNVDCYKINGEETVSKIWARPLLTMNYRINNKSSIYLYGIYGNSIPQMSSMNSAEQYSTQYEVLRGNPDLKSMQILNGLLAYNHYVKWIQMSAYVQYEGLFDVIKRVYSSEGNIMASTYMNNGDYHSITTAVNGTLSFFNRTLQISCGLFMKNQILTGMMSAHNNRLTGRLRAVYFSGKFTFSGYYEPYSKNLVTTPMFTERRSDYGISVSYGYKGWYAEAGCKRIFENNPYTRSYYNYGEYSTDCRNFSDSNDKQIYLKLSYNFDFGRKTDKKKIELNTSAKSGILKL